MLVYHGSTVKIEKPDLTIGRHNLDFGKGFYTTTLKDQAEKWAKRFKRRFGAGVVSIYEIDDGDLKDNISVLQFDTYSMDWLDFIIECRQGTCRIPEKTADSYDLVIGGIANDDVFNTLTIYLRGLIDKSEALKRLCYEKPNIQYCFKTQKAMDKYLCYIGNETL